MENIPLNGLDKYYFTIILIGMFVFAFFIIIGFRKLLITKIHKGFSNNRTFSSDSRSKLFLYSSQFLYAKAISFFLTFLIRINGNINVVEIFLMILAIVIMYLVSKNLINRIVFNIIGINKLFPTMSNYYYHNSLFIVIISVFYIFLTYPIWNVQNYYNFLIIILILWVFFYFRIIINIFYDNNFGWLNFILYICNVEVFIFLFFSKLLVYFV